MKYVKFSHFLRVVSAAGLISASLTVQAQAVNVADAEALLLTNKCAKCHS
jgi:cytochrome c551/c552